MWIDDILKALWDLERYNCCIDKIENGIIYFSDGSTESIRKLAKKYDEARMPKNDF